jgi:hypothetical protein
MMDSTNPNSIFAEYKKVIGQFKLPGIDVGAILESRRKDIEAIAEANTTALAGVQSLAQKQSEILHTTLTELQSALVDMQELADTAYRAQADSVAVVTKRVAEHVEELKTLLQPKK